LLAALATDPHTVATTRREHCEQEGESSHLSRVHAS